MEEDLSILRLHREGLEDIITAGAGEDDDEDGGEFGVGRVGRSASLRRAGAQRWKVLVYDAVGRDILATLVRVSDLRSLGVTLHLNLESSRQAIPDVPAVYFCAPTEANVRRIAQDCSNNLYEATYVNFTSSVPREVLEVFAESVAQMSRSAASSIKRVFDGYCSFVSLEDDFFSLDVANAYTMLNDRNLKDDAIEANIDRIVTGLFSAVVTLGHVPVVRAQRGGPAEMVAARLDDRIRDALSVRANVFSENAHQTSYTAVPQRLMLIILDRSLDLPVMLHHTWTYQALTHDLLQMKLNRVTINVKEGNENFASGRRTFDLDKSDTFWKHNAGFPFPKVAEAVENSLNEYKKEVEDINRQAGAVGGDVQSVNQANGTDDLARALKTLPELTKRKQMVDLHTNIATALLDQIKDRNLDAFFHAEDQLMNRAAVDHNTLVSLLRDSSGTPDDKMRLFVIYALCCGADADLDKYVPILSKAGCDMRAVKYIKEVKAFTDRLDLKSTLQSMTISAPPAQSSVTDTGLGKMMSSIVEHGSKGLTQVANNFNKLILEEDKAVEAARVVESLMEGRGKEDVIENYAYFDARQPRSSVSKSRKPCRQAVVFMVGGGSYVEYQNVKDHLKGGKRVIYGCTDLVNGEDFLRQLETLSGKPKPQPEGTGDKNDLR